MDRNLTKELEDWRFLIIAHQSVVFGVGDWCFSAFAS